MSDDLRRARRSAEALQPAARTAEVVRETSESRVRVWVDLDGTGRATVATEVGFFDHMLASLAKHSLIDLVVESSGDVEVDAHHVVEDTAIVLGQALAAALGDKRGIGRFGYARVPLDEALAECTVDVAGRPYVVCSGEPDAQVYARIGGSGVPYAGSMTRHVVESLALNAGLCVHLTLLAGRDPHHVVEAQFKALARALRAAVEPDPRTAGLIPSTKGAL
jgi:imidazoleglycerol-phosphate dehydratase